MTPPRVGAARNTLPPGTRIGPYEITEHIAVGGMAHVYKVWHSGLHRHEAMKVPLTRLSHEPEFLRRFFQEARFAAKLQHPNIVGIHAVSDEFGDENDAEATTGEGESYFTMELVEGTDLDHLLAENGRLPLEDTVALLRGIADALDYAHARGVVHRDMKPSNILLQTAPGMPGGYIPKVSDFGIARAAAADEDMGDGVTTKPQRLTKAGAILGTPSYMSPEQAGNGEPVGPCSDMYSLGVIAYEMLAGYTPFPWKPESPMSVILNHLRDEPPPISGVGQSLAVDTSVNAVLRRVLAKTPAQRFPTCRAFVDALAEASRAITIPNPVVNTTTGTTNPGTGRQVVFGPNQNPLRPTTGETIAPIPQPKPDNKLAMIFGGIVLAVAAVGGGIVLMSRHPAPTPETLTASPAPKPTVAAPNPKPSVDPNAAKIQAHTAQSAKLLANLAGEFRRLQEKKANHQLTPQEANAALVILTPEAKDALSEADSALKLDKKNRDAMADRIDALIYLNRMADAEKQAKDALVVYPGDTAFMSRLQYLQGGKTK